MAKCRICQTEYQPFIDFGPMPISNNFLSEKDFPREYFFSMKAGFCHSCSMVQLLEQPAADVMFHDNYTFFSGTSRLMAEHFKKFADDIKQNYLSDKASPFVVEIGSNDGIMLQNFAEAPYRHLGVEPSANVARVAQEKGLNSIVRFFNLDTAKEIVTAHGHADAFLAANCMCHIPTLHDIIEGIAHLMAPGGVVAFEDPYLGEVIRNTSFDQLYDEHVFLFSLHSISAAFAQHGFELIDAKPLETHGGSMRYYLSQKGKRPVSPRVKQLLQEEVNLGLLLPETYDKFRLGCEQIRDDLKYLLIKLKRDGKRVVGYAATSKSTTLLNYAGIGPDLIDFISDTTPLKQGKFSPGMHIPVLAAETLQGNYPEYLLLFAYNHQKEIFAKEAQFAKDGGKWIMFVPNVHVVE